MPSPKFQEVPLDMLSIEVEYQRPLNPQFVAKLAREWDASLVGAITVMSHQNSLVLVDGQHRVAAAQRLGIPALVAHVIAPSRDLSVAVEGAKRFVGLNNTRALTPIDRYRAEVVAKMPPSIDIERFLSSIGWCIANTHGKHVETGLRKIQWVTRLTTAWTRDEASARQACFMLDTIASRGEALDGRVFLGVFLLLVWGTPIGGETNRLRGNDCYARMVAKCRNANTITGGGSVAGRAYASEILGVINRGKHRSRQIAIPNGAAT